MAAATFVDRARLRSRLERLRPAIFSLVAPAGYGKTALVRLLYGDDPRTRICDCDGVRDDLDLARRLVPEIKDELSDGSRTVAERLSLALDRLFASPPERLVLDRARFIGGSPEALEFLAHLFERRTASMTIVLSSREALPLRLTRFAAPHEIVVLRAADLAFDRDEQRELLAPYVTDPAALERIARVSEGWPIALFLLQRFAREGRLEKLFARLNDVAFGELHDYLADEVLAMFDSATLQALFACAAMPFATDADVRDVFPDARSGDALAEFAKESPFLHRDADARYSVHPLIAAAVLEHQEERKRLLVEQLAIAREADGDYVRAAELHIANGQWDIAAAALAQYNVLILARLPERYARLLKMFAPSQLLRFPELYGLHALMRLFREPPEALFDEAEAVWRTIPATAPLRDRHAIFILRIYLMAYLGRHAQARAELLAMSQRKPSPKFETVLLALHAFVSARLGKLNAASADIERALPSIMEADAMAAGLHVTLAEVARMRGDRMEMQFLERGLARARESRVESAQALVLARIAISSWFSGDDVRAKQAAQDLERLAERGFSSVAYLAGALLRRDVEPQSGDLPEFIVYGQLIQLADAVDERRRIELGTAALAGAERLGIPFLYMLAAIALALCDEDRYEELTDVAASRAEAIDSEVLRSAARAIVERRLDCGIFSAAVARFTRGREAVVPPIEVFVASGRVRVDGAPVSIGGRELELLLAIALRREPVSRARLAALLWPDLDESAARNVFSVSLHRLRSHLSRKDAVERDGDGYRLHARAAVDIWELELVMGAVRKRAAVRERDRAELERLWRALNEEPPIRVEQWEWFEPTARRLRESRIELAHMLGEDALDRADPVAALVYAHAALEEDGCDELGAEIAIKAQLASGDRAGAMRRYRQYRSALQAELGVEPSASLTALVTTP